MKAHVVSTRARLFDYGLVSITMASSGDDMRA